MKIKCSSRKTVELIGPLAGAKDTSIVKYKKVYYRYCGHCNEIYKHYMERCPRCFSGKITL